MTTKTVTTKSGKTIKIELVREVQDKVAYADGDNIVVGREIIEYTTITFLSDKKIIASGSGVTMLNPGVPTNKKMIEQGAVARLGDAYISQDVVNQINTVLSELDIENPKSAEYLAIKQAKADTLARWEAEAPERQRIEEFERKMSRHDSDY